MTAPRYIPVDSIQTHETRGPWRSKSGGNLDVMCAMSRKALSRFLDFDNPDFETLPHDIRGLRLYTVSDIPAGAIGGAEWHKIRTELVTALSGRAILQCVDLQGAQRDFTLDGRVSVIIPPSILHTYQALEDNTRLQVVANTLFIPEEPSTHDTFSKETFLQLMQRSK